MRFLVLFSLITLLFSCSKPPVDIKMGTWRGIISLQGQELPFTFEVAKVEDSYVISLVNDTEKIPLDEIYVDGDSLKMVLHIFDADLRAKVEGDQMTGTFYKNYAPQASLPFRATYGENYRFLPVGNAEGNTDYSGKYQLVFKTDKDTYASVGIFNQNGNHLTGTFLTPMGDYRFLEGNVVNSELRLSTFDGNHAFLFVARLKGDSLIGDYYSGKASHETFKGIRNQNAVMPDLDAMTFLKPGYDKVDFKFPDLDHQTVSPTDERFRNKVLILQIFGTWCPNCMDETKFLSGWYKENHERGVEILGLAYERKDDFEYASSRIRKMVERLGVPYDFVVAGVNDKEKAAQTLPMLNKVIAFPTTIIIGKDGKVKHIRTGFEGPGTGVYHDQFKEHFNQIINELLAEESTSQE